MTEEDRMEGLNLLEAVESARNEWAIAFNTDHKSAEAEERMDALDAAKAPWHFWCDTHARALLDDGWRGIETVPTRTVAGMKYLDERVMLAEPFAAGWHVFIESGGHPVPINARMWRNVPEPPPETKP